MNVFFNYIATEPWYHISVGYIDKKWYFVKPEREYYRQHIISKQLILFAPLWLGVILNSFHHKCNLILLSIQHPI